jgi:hypothetical protein
VSTELATLSLWGALGLLLGGVAAPAGLLTLVAAWRLGRTWRRPSVQVAAAPSFPQLPGEFPGPLLQSSADQGRSAMAQQFGLREVDLFRAQHTSVCRVHHDERGGILRIECLNVPGALAPVVPDLHAHPVG